MLTLRLSPKARRDIDNIWDYTVERWSEGQAVEYLRSLDSAFEILVEFPRVGRLLNKVEPEVRMYVHRSHVVIYRVRPGVLDVVRVPHSRSNWIQFLSDDKE